MKSDHVGLHSPLSNISHHLSRWCLDGDLMSQGTNAGTPRAAGTTLKISNHPNHFLFDKKKNQIDYRTKTFLLVVTLMIHNYSLWVSPPKKSYSEKLLINVLQEVND